MHEREHAENPAVSYQPDEVAVGAIVRTAVGLVLFLCIAGAVSLAAYAVFAAVEDRRQPSVPAFVTQDSVKLSRDLECIPKPLLEKNDRDELVSLRQMENARLQSYGWVDSKGEHVHIPIAEAMKILADPNVAKRHGIQTMAPSPKGAPR